MSNLAFHVGRHGDLLWSLATLKELAKEHGRFDLHVSDYLRPMVPLLRAQPYVGDVLSDPDWKVEFSAPASPRFPPEFQGVAIGYALSTWKKIINLSLEGWPDPNLLEDPARRFGMKVDCWTPWLSPLSQSGFVGEKRIGISFTDEWCELKAGLIHAIIEAFPDEKFYLFTHPGARLAREWGWGSHYGQDLVTIYTGVSGLSDWLMDCKLLICCASMARVMNLGLGGRNAVIEPSVPRHQAVFHPPEPNLEREQILFGFDAREAVELVRGML